MRTYTERQFLRKYKARCQERLKTVSKDRVERYPDLLAAMRKYSPLIGGGTKNAKAFSKEVESLVKKYKIRGKKWDEWFHTMEDCSYIISWENELRDVNNSLWTNVLVEIR